ncbi:hypothetical protein NE865_05213 [Phthorimaea operculella]|nr:hypothetical protein NE865_05213 [Phthorimaea operculella]
MAKDDQLVEQNPVAKTYVFISLSMLELALYPRMAASVVLGHAWSRLTRLKTTRRLHQWYWDTVEQADSPEDDQFVELSPTWLYIPGWLHQWYWDTEEQADPPEDDQFVELNPVAETCVFISLSLSILHLALYPRMAASVVLGHGWLHQWYWDTVEQADPPEDDQFVELNPVAETCVFISLSIQHSALYPRMAASVVPDCKIMCLKHQKDMYWYCQDGNGGIWTVDIELDKLECTHTKLLTRHAGPVVSIISMRTHPIVVTGGADGAVMAYNNEARMPLVRYVFPAPVTCMLYAPIELDPTSRVVIAGFGDGVIRTLLIHPARIIEIEEMIEVRVHSTLTIHSEDSEHPDVIDLISWLKPHPKPINQITINPHHTLLITCGEDSTIFMYKIVKGGSAAPFDLKRLGFIETPQIIRFMTWNPDPKEDRKILLCGDLGLVMEAVLPATPIRKYSDITTFLINFDSYTETYIKKQYLRHRPFPTEDDLASIDEEALKAAAEMADKDKDDDEEWIGEIQLIEEEKQPGKTILWAEYTDEGIWITQQGTGALLLIKPGNTKILKYGPIPGAWTDDLTTLRFICNRRYIIIGTNNGYIRVLRMPTEEEDCPDYHMLKWIKDQKRLLKELKGRRLAEEEKQPIPQIDLFDNYYLQMHDRYTGHITCLEFSVDGKYFFTTGGDGNIFSYLINFPEPFFPPPELPEEPELLKMEKVGEPSTIDGVIMCHEQLKQKEEYDKMMAIANAHKKRVRDQLSELTVEYNVLIKANRMLPWSQQIDINLDPRPIEAQEVELEEAKALTIRKIAHQLEKSDIGLHKMYSRNIIQLDVYPFTLRAIRDPKIMIRPFRQKNLSQSFFDQLAEVHRKMAEAALRSRRPESLARRATMKKMSWGPPRVASFLLGLPPNPSHPLKKLLRNYYQRLNRHHLQFIEWQEHLARKPDPNALPPGAAEALKEAEATIGNFLLKTDPDYVAPPGHNTQLRLCLTRQEIYDTKHKFNQKVVDMRQQKLALVDLTTQIAERLMEIRAEIPAKLAKQPPNAPAIDEELEFPEKNLEVKPKPIVWPVKAAAAAAGKRASMAISAESRKSQLAMIYPQQRIRQPKVARFVPLSESRPLVYTWEILKPRPDQTSSPMEIEVRDRRIERHLFEQDVLLSDAAEAVQKFDARLRYLQRERIRVQEKSQLLELHLYQLHQEMNVLNRFEAHEDRLAERVYEKLMQTSYAR